LKAPLNHIHIPADKSEKALSAIGQRSW